MAMRVTVLALAISAIEASQAVKPGKMNAFDTSCYVAVADSPLEVGGDKGKSYRGLVSFTMSGRTCQKWTEVHPWKEAADITPTMDQKEDVDGSTMTTWGNGIGNHNYCRNPDSSMGSPWCFTMDTNAQHKKELCEIPQCEGERDFKDEAGDLALKIGSQDCECADQLYGSLAQTGSSKTTSLIEEECPCAKNRPKKLHWGSAKGGRKGRFH